MRQNGSLVTSGGTAQEVSRSGELLAYDALGNLDTALTVDSVRISGVETSASRRGRTATYQANVGRLLAEASAEGNKTYLYDPSGNLGLSIREEASGPGDHPRENRFTYYGADERVRAVDSRSAFPGDADLQLRKYVFDEYRYDALGRRVWVQSDRDCADDRTGANQNDEWLECNVGTLRRTVWDGTQELFEIQVPYRLPGEQPQPNTVLENDAYLANLPRFGSGKDPNPYFGRVLYVHGLAVDEPVAIVRYNYVDFLFSSQNNHIAFPPTSFSLFWNALGKLGPVVCGSGQAECQATSSGRTVNMGMNVPSNWFVLDRPKLDSIMPRFFQGSLVADKQDASGVLFRRNRYYDPSTGRFTQEDPIGLAGGLNLYGFASGDPVNFADPFGLCGKRQDQEPCPKGHVYTLSIGVAGAYFIGGNANVGVAFNTEGVRLFANTGGSFGLGASLTRIAGSEEQGSLENYGPIHTGDFFRSTVANPSVSAPISVGRIKGSSKENYQPVSEGRGWLLGFGPGLGIFSNYTDYQVSSRIVPWISEPTAMSYTCAKTGVGCTNR